MPALPPGDYVVRVERQGFHPAEQVGVRVGIDREVTLELRILPMFREEVTVASAAPIVDVTGTTTSIIVEQKVFKELPVARSYRDLAFLAPGVVEAGSPGQPSINGSSTSENRYFMDGLDVTDPEGGTLKSTLPVEFLEQVEIKTGGFDPEYGGAMGGIVNVVTRSGSNDLHGSLFGYYTDDSLKSQSPTSVQNVQFLGFKEYDAGGTLGGRIVRDRLWYFLGLDPPQARQEHWTTRQAIRVTDRTEHFYYTGKLNWQLHSSHELAVSAFGDPEKAVSHFRNAAGILKDETRIRSKHVVLSYNGILTSGAFLEFSAGRYDQNDRKTPAADMPWYADQSGGRFAIAQNCGDPNPLVGGFLRFAQGCLGGTEAALDDTSRDELRAAATLHGKTGRLDHEIKAGASLLWVKYDQVDRFPGPAPGPFFDSEGTLVNLKGPAGQLWVLRPNVAHLIDVDLDSLSRNQEEGLFLQDRVRINERLMVNLGLRADAFDSTGDRTAQDPNFRLKFGFGEMISPRIGVAWDPMGSGRSKLFAHYGRSYESVPLALNFFAFGTDRTFSYDFAYPAGGALPDAHNPGTLISSQAIGGSASHVSTDIKPMYTDEYLLGFEYQVRPEVSVGVTVIYRDIGNVVEDISFDGGHTAIITNTGGTFRVDPVTRHPLETPVFFPELVRRYRAVQFAFQKRLRDNWQLFGSYVYSRDEGNYPGADGCCANLTDIALRPEFLENASGLLPNDRTHQVKLYGSYHWLFGLTSGFSSRYLSGSPISKLGSFPGFLGFGRRFVTARGSAGRTPDLFTLDLHLGYPMRFGKSGISLELFADVFNVADSQKVTLVDETWTFTEAAKTDDPHECGGPGTGDGTACPDGNPNWGGALAFQEPRTLRFGVRLSW
jgi:TonB-dependent receptor-like protein